MIDSHLHLWDLDLAGPAEPGQFPDRDSAGHAYAWLGPQHGSLYRSYGESEAHETLVDAGVEGAVLVQADDTLLDTEFMLAVADRNDWVLGVVGWIPLEHPDQAGAALERFGQNPKFCGVRHLIHNDPRENFLEKPEVRESLRLVAAKGLALDIPDAYPRHLGRASDLARDLPELTVVLDHLGKPPRSAPTVSGTGSAPGLERWRREFRALSELPNTVAKVSGLHTPGLEYTARALRPLWEEALACFGPERLMIGMDWPVSALGQPYGRTLEVLMDLASDLDAASLHAFLEGSAIRAYAIEKPGPRTPSEPKTTPEPESTQTKQDEVGA